MVMLTGTNFTEIEDDVDANGYAMNFKSEGDATCGGSGTAPCVLDHEIELYDTTNNKLVAWVRIPALDYNDDSVIYLHYGNPNVIASTENPNGVWESNFKGVWHFAETSGNYLDSTGNDNDSSSISVTSRTATGKIGYGPEFDGIDDQIEVPNSISLNIQTDDVTVEGWMYSDDTTPNGSIAMKSDDDGDVFYGLTFETDEIWVYTHTDSSCSGWNWGTGYNFPSAGWHHVAFAYDGTDRRLYIDGDYKTNSACTTDIRENSAEPLMIGWNPFDPGGSTDGIVDEVRISKYPRDACWIGTEYSNQKADSTFISVDSEESWTFAHYKTITIDKDYVGSSCTTDLTDFPLMVTLTGTDFTEIENDVQSAQGYDIIFKDAGGNQLAHEIEQYDETNDQLIAWVKVPRLSATSDTVITMHYGNSDITSSTQNAAGVWDGNYLAVYHMNQDPTGTVYDSTDNSIHMTARTGMERFE
jgi:hypothetical protein